MLKFGRICRSLAQYSKVSNSVSKTKPEIPKLKSLNDNASRNDKALKIFQGPSASGSGNNTIKLGLALTLGVVIGSLSSAYSISEKPPPFLFPKSSTTPLKGIIAPQYANEKTIEQCRTKLEQVLGKENVVTTEEAIKSHNDTYWNSHHPESTQFPKYVVYGTSTEQVSEIMKICHEYSVPMVPFTGGTSLEGHFISTRSGISLDLSRMDKVLELHKEDLDVVVQPGVGWETLADYLDDYGLLFGPDPGPSACIGGMVGTSCSGTNASRYGTMKENVLNLTVVLADGTIIKTKQRPTKSSAGYNLTGLFIGSEGTLGVVTEATLRLHVKPPFQTVAVVAFPGIRNAASTVADIVGRGLQVDAMELVDDNMMRYINASGETTQKYNEVPTLFFKLGGPTKNAVDDLKKTVKDIADHYGAVKMHYASKEDEKLELWNARKVALWSTINYGRESISPDIQVWTTDVAVPISRLPDVLLETKKDIDSSGLPSSMVGHAGDGNFHVFLLYKKDQHERAARIVDRMVQRAIAMGGTCTGEHGVGYGKRGFLLEEDGHDTVDLMRKIKFAIDPKRILNPDKIFSIDPNDDPLNSLVHS
ncbi:hypothetical protein LJB42_004051 [Komagataella kurtzmanii]|nr:hypothetical protein LJB42_004051 [Komagataella kurtzmanii]